MDRGARTLPRETQLQQTKGHTNSQCFRGVKIHFLAPASCSSPTQLLQLER